MNEILEALTDSTIPKINFVSQGYDDASAEFALLVCLSTGKLSLLDLTGDEFKIIAEATVKL